MDDNSDTDGGYEYSKGVCDHCQYVDDYGDTNVMTMALTIITMTIPIMMAKNMCYIIIMLISPIMLSFPVTLTLNTSIPTLLMSLKIIYMNIICIIIIMLIMMLIMSAL